MLKIPNDEKLINAGQLYRLADSEYQNLKLLYGDSELVRWAESVRDIIGELAYDLPDANTVDIKKALDWLNGYTIVDTKQEYTNGTVLVPLFRVAQAFEDKAYNGMCEA